MSECCKRLLNLLQRLQGKIDEFPPQEIQTRWLEPDLCFLRQLSSRYGNPAYRDWFASLENEGEQLLAEVVAGTGKEG